MVDQRLVEIIDDNLDVDYLVHAIMELSKVPTDVPMGFDTFIEPDHPKLVAYVQDHVRPMLYEIGCYDLLDAGRNNLVVRTDAAATSGGVLIQNYTPTQHHNLMHDPFKPRIETAAAYGVDLPAIFAQGVSQNKAHQGVMLAVLKLLRDGGIPLESPLYWSVNGEGLSSHYSSNLILPFVKDHIDFCVIQLGTSLAISRANRGRVDVNARVQGKATHSSTPEQGRSAIDGLYEVMSRLRGTEWPAPHPVLGRRQAIVYKVAFEPMAPHTLPETAQIAIDRRLLPGDTPEAATDEIRDLLSDLGDFTVEVTEGYSMLPHIVEEDDPNLTRLADSHALATGDQPRQSVSEGTFDAGGPGAFGIPTVMYGASGGIWPTGADFVTIDDAVTEAKTLALFVLDKLTTSLE